MAFVLSDDAKMIAERILDGEVIALPTDTVYGFSCLANSESAVNMLQNIKNETECRSYILLVSKNYDLTKLMADKEQIDFVQKNSPNPVSFIVNKNPDLLLAKTFSLPTIAIRIPNDEFLQSILDKVGFMISTSCNIHGEQNINNPQEIMEKFSEYNIGVLFGDVKANVSSTLVDITGESFKILRQGEYIVKI